MKFKLSYDRGLLQVFLGLVIFACTYLALWIHKVDPLPEAQSLRGFFHPFLNYLEASLHFPNNFKVLAEQVVLSENSFGGLIIAYFVAAFGLQNLFLQNPFLVQIFLLLPLFYVITKHRLGKWQRILLGALVFFFPVTQILLKGVASESFSVIYALSGIYFLKAHTIRSRKRYLVGLVLSLGFAMSAHPLGIFLSFQLIIALVVHGFYTARFKIAPILCVCLSALSSLPFHHWESFYRFSALIKIESSTAAISWLLFLFLLPIPVVWILKLTLRSFGRVYLPRFFNGGLVLGALIVLTLYLLARDQEWIYLNIFNLFLIGIGSVSIAWILGIYNFKTIRGLLYLCTLIGFHNAVILHIFLYEPSLYLFFLWFILLVIQTYLETSSITRKLLFVGACFLTANFCPNLTQVQIWLGDAGLRIFTSGLRNLHTNPLSWQSSDTHAIREELLSIMETRREIIPDSFSIYVNMHRNSRLVFQNPPDFSRRLKRTSRLDDLPHENLRSMSEVYVEQGDALFDSWLATNKISYLVYALHPWELNLWPPDPLEEVLSSSERIGEAGLHLGRAFYQYLRKSAKLKAFFDLYPIPSHNPRLLLCVNKGLPQIINSGDQLGSELSAVAYHFPVDFTRGAIPFWFAGLESGVQKAILSREAIFIFEQGLRQQEMADFFQALISFKLANQLDKKNLKIRQHLTDLEMKFPDVALEFIEAEVSSRKLF